MRYRMNIAYDGTHYFGWQTQPGHRSIQGELEAAVKEMTGEQVRLHSSGRTDRGVHARAQVAHFDLESKIQPRSFQLGMNALVDADIRVSGFKKTTPEFHARFDPVAKEYRYFIWNGPLLPPHVRLYRTQVRRRLDVASMNQAAERLVGRHDFAAFSANPNRERHGTVRMLHTLAVRRKGHEITVVAGGEGFLYKMVRSLTGFLVRVGSGELHPETATEILVSRVRTAQVPTAQPQGLFLWKVWYN